MKLDKRLPLITIITSTLNANVDLNWTIKSIRAQTLQTYQWIIIDGGSIDGTVDLIKQNSDIISAWLSEPDRGIYDAWSKAIPLVKGEWVQFLGAGDEYFSQDTLELMSYSLLALADEYNLVYGNSYLISPKSRIILEDNIRPWDVIKGKWDGFRPALPVHAEVFHRAKILNQRKCFGEDFRIAGDSYLLLNNILNKAPLYIPLSIAKIQYGGLSNRPEFIKRALLESKRVCQVLNIRIPIKIIIKEYIKLFCKLLILKIAGENNFFKLANYYRQSTSRKSIWGIE